MDKLTHSPFPPTHPAHAGDRTEAGAIYLTTDTGDTYRITARNGALVIEVDGRGSIAMAPKSVAGVFISTSK